MRYSIVRVSHDTGDLLNSLAAEIAVEQGQSRMVVNWQIIRISKDSFQSKLMCFLQSSLDELLTTVMRQRKITNNLKAKWRLQKSKLTTKTTEAKTW